MRPAGSPRAAAPAGPGPSSVRARAAAAPRQPWLAALARGPPPPRAPSLARLRTGPAPPAAARPGSAGAGGPTRPEREAGPASTPSSGRATPLEPRRRASANAAPPHVVSSEPATTTTPSTDTPAPPKPAWRVRPIRPDEVAEAAGIQARAFYEAAPLSLLDGLLFYAFQGEVLAGLQAKMKYSADQGFACLVAEALPPDRDWGSAAGGRGRDDAPPPVPPQFKGIVGVVEVSLQAEPDGLAALQRLGAGGGGGDEAYAYIACMAVDPGARRAGVASALLAGAERAAGRWRQNWCLLHVHDANEAAVRLYGAAGYTPLATDGGSGSNGAAGPLAVFARPKPRTLMGRASRLAPPPPAGGGAAVVPTITSIRPDLLALMARAAAAEEEEEAEGSV